MSNKKPKPPLILPLWHVAREYCKRAVELCGGNITQAAKMLDIDRVTLRKKLRERD
jgi:DNA-binding protein Fis